MDIRASAVRSFLKIIGAACIVAGATWLRYLLIEPLGMQGPFVVYYVAIFACTYYLGLWPGIFAILCSAAAAFYYFFEPSMTWEVRNSSQIVFVSLYVLTSLLIVALTEHLQRQVEWRTALERNLRHSEETFRGIFENAQEDAIILMDEDRRVVAWNSGAENITGWAQEEAIDRPADIIFTPEDREEAVPEEEVACAAKNGYASDNRWHVKKDGSRFWANGTMTVLRHSDGTPRGFIKIFRDETERKRLQDMLESANEELENRVAERTKELQSLVKELEGFTYSISHDMRAPLRSMVAHSQMLLEDYGGGIPEDGKKHLARISFSALKMAQLVEDLLIHSRLGRAEVKRTDCDLAAMTLEIAAGLDQGCEVEILEGADLTVRCDSSLIKLVLQNLLENACKYRDRDSIARISVGRFGDTFYVRDQGIGFEMQYADRIFEPFERLHRDSDYPGTGIGLANAKRIIELHGGRIWAESTPGKGSTFYFTLS